MPGRICIALQNRCLSSPTHCIAPEAPPGQYIVLLLAGGYNWLLMAYWQPRLTAMLLRPAEQLSSKCEHKLTEARRNRSVQSPNEHIRFFLKAKDRIAGPATEPASALKSKCHDTHAALRYAALAPLLPPDGSATPTSQKQAGDRTAATGWASGCTASPA
jgi:hypothetical protein